MHCAYCRNPFVAVAGVPRLEEDRKGGVMFYCEDCRQNNNWPESMSKSTGRCEECGDLHICYDTPSAVLRDIEQDRREERERHRDIEHERERD